MQSRLRLAPMATAERDGRAWVLSTTVLPPSGNVCLREHWRARTDRRDLLIVLFRQARLAAGVASPVFPRAKLATALYFGDGRRRDADNYVAGLKEHIDALRLAGWVPDDHAGVLHQETPTLDVDRANPRCVLRLEPWRRGGVIPIHGAVYDPEHYKPRPR